MIHQYTIASRIPHSVRQLRILTAADPIMHAQPNSSNLHMMLLAAIWYTFIEPHKEKSYCPICLANILQNFKAMKADLLALEKQDQLLSKL